jgi:hypothetical protein
MTRILLVLTFALTAVGEQSRNGPTTLANNDSCDIGLAPAATLLLPFFEVDFDSVTGQNTLFTITNTGQRAQVARVTLWTDFAYPVLTFDIYLTGYDVQSISLYDVFGRGIIGGEQGTGVDVSPVGELSKRNPLLDRSDCGQVPRRIEPALLTQLRIAFTEGVVPGCPTAGNEHLNARGYATIDVVGNCAPGRGPTDPRYFSEDIRYDNVLIGDSISVDAGERFAQASPMVHIRALPGGGTPSTRIPGPLPRLEKTFYGRFQDPADPHLDARQPLPSTFAARWINGGRGGSAPFCRSGATASPVPSRRARTTSETAGWWSRSRWRSTRTRTASGSRDRRSSSAIPPASSSMIATSPSRQSPAPQPAMRMCSRRKPSTTT